MKEITILSGKGGAGKTSVAAALASVMPNAVFCDNDVDAADLHLILKPEVKETHAFDSGSLAFIDEPGCKNCGICEKACEFDAIHKNENGFPEVNPYQCEGCYLCERLCPVGAISVKQNLNNFWYVSETRFGQVVHAKMGAGEENSGKLVAKIRERAKEIAIETNADLIINDGPPGIGCTAISSVTGVDLVLLVIEPTVSGLHDAKRLVELVRSFKIPMVAIINKADINLDFVKEVKVYLKENEIRLLAEIPFSEIFVKAMLEEKTVVEYASEHSVSLMFKEVGEKIMV